MSYLGFARKYRPKVFEEVSGQEEIAVTLQNAIRSGRVHHAYLFAGSRGVGKTSMARIFAKALNCAQGPTPAPCNECEFCVRIGKGEDIDVVEIDGASNRGIEEIRSIKENVKYLTSRARFKIFIIDEVHMLTTAAFNALLKTLEEPPSHVKFILATTQLTSIPDTILSRCQRFQFKKIGVPDIVKRLLYIAEKEGLALSPEIAESIAHKAGGAMRDSAVLFDQMVAYSGGTIDCGIVEKFLSGVDDEGTELLNAVSERNAGKVLHAVHEFFSQGGDPSALIERMLQQLRDILVAGACPNPEKLVEGSPGYQQWVSELCKKFSAEFLTCSILQLLDAKSLIHRSLMGRIVLETVLLKILRAESLLPLAKLEESLLALEQRMESRISANRGTVPHVQERTPEAIPQAPIGIQPEPMLREKPQKAPAAPVSESKSQEARPAPGKIRPETGPRSAAGRVPPPEIEARKAAQPENSAKSRPRETRETSETQPEQRPAQGGWPQFLRELSEKFPQAASLLSAEAHARVEAQRIVVTIPQQYHMVSSLLTSAPNKSLIKDLMERAFGCAVPLQFEYGGGQDSSVRETEKQIEEDPIVLKTLELFEGRIVGRYPANGVSKQR